MSHKHLWVKNTKTNGHHITVRKKCIICGKEMEEIYRFTGDGKYEFYTEREMAKAKKSG